MPFDVSTFDLSNLHLWMTKESMVTGQIFNNQILLAVEDGEDGEDAVPWSTHPPSDILKINTYRTPINPPTTVLVSSFKMTGSIVKEELDSVQVILTGRPAELSVGVVLEVREKDSIKPNRHLMLPLITTAGTRPLQALLPQ